MNISKRVVCAMFMAVAGLTSTGSFAAEENAPGSGPNPYTDCGIGAALFPDTHWAAVTSNIIWDLGTTALTSATASPETCKGKNLQAAMFIGTSYEGLIEDTAAGRGKHLTAMLNLFGCNAAHHAAAANAVRVEVGKTVAGPDHKSKTRLEKVSTYFDVAEKATSAKCSA